jgi:hypothetical protein
MTPEQIAAKAVQIAGSRAQTSQRTQMNLVLNCAGAADALAVRDELAGAGLSAMIHNRFANSVVVQLRQRQQIIIQPARKGGYMPRFNGDRGER